MATSASGVANNVSILDDYQPNAVYQANQAFDQINATTNANNAWSAAQAEKQMDFQREQNKAAMDFNAAEAAKNRDWQKMMSDTAHQREIRDLQAAGLNPILSATGGNGAAVTSGATASGVTSSGAMGQTDTSKNSAIVQLLSSMLQYKNNLDMANINAQTNLAVADKYNAMSKYMSELNAATNLQTAGMSAAASRDVAGISASASRYASDVHLQAQQYASDIQSATSKVVASINAEASDRNSTRAQKATQYAASVNAAAQRYATDQNNANRKALQEAQQQFTEYLKKYYPDNPYAMSSSFPARLQDWNFFKSGFKSGDGFGSR